MNVARNVNDGAEKRLPKHPTAASLKKLLTAKDRMEKQGAEARGSYGAAVQALEKDENLHKRAWSGVAALVKMGEQDPVKLNEYLFHFDAMRKLLGVDAMRAADMLDADRNGAAVDGKPAKGKPKAKAKPGKNVVKFPRGGKSAAAAEAPAAH